jgi:hypothetical protein
MRRIGWLTGVGALALAVTTAVAAAEPRPVKFTREWEGEVADGAKGKNAPEVITNGKALEKLWKDWGVAGKTPEVDFAKEIVVVGTTRGSRIDLVARLDDKGNLEVLSLVPRDLGERQPGFRYAIATVPREGVKTVNKKELPKE